MENQPTTITVETTVNAPVAKVWQIWTTPEDIIQWNNASDDWHTPRAENDLTIDGKFNFGMEAKDGSAGFDFIGTYTEIDENSLIAYTIADGRKVNIRFLANGDETRITQSFEAENENSVELQQMGGQAILDNFKKYAEAN